MKIQGLISYCNAEKKYHFIEVKTAVKGGGFLVERYYLNESQIVFIIPDRITIGNVVRFEVLNRPKRFVQELPSAINVEVFQTQEQADTFARVKAESELAAPSSSKEGA